jgi:hypothetical protein
VGGGLWVVDSCIDKLSVFTYLTAEIAELAENQELEPRSLEDAKEFLGKKEVLFLH